MIRRLIVAVPVENHSLSHIALSEIFLRPESIN